MILVIWSSKLKPAKSGDYPQTFLQTLRPRPTRFAEFVVVVFCSFGVCIYIYIYVRVCICQRVPRLELKQSSLIEQ